MCLFVYHTPRALHGEVFFCLLSLSLIHSCTHIAFTGHSPTAGRFQLCACSVVLASKISNYKIWYYSWLARCSMSSISMIKYYLYALRSCRTTENTIEHVEYIKSMFVSVWSRFMMRRFATKTNKRALVFWGRWRGQNRKINSYWICTNK